MTASTPVLPGRGERRRIVETEPDGASANPVAATNPDERGPKAFRTSTKTDTGATSGGAEGMPNR
jgi:hypothetical protein